MNVATLLQDRARETPDRLAILDFSGRTPRSITFGELDEASSNAAAAFGELAPGTRVALVHPMNLNLYVALAGLLRAGLVPVVCDPGAGRSAVAACCARVAPEAIVASAAGFAYAATIPALRRSRRFFGDGLLSRSQRTTRSFAGGAVQARLPGDPAILTFTSGSTGMPKVVVRSHAVLRAQLEAICAMLPLGGIDVTTMPVVALANLASGVTSVIPGVDLRRPGAADPERLADDIERNAATSVVASPAMLERLTHIDARKRVRTIRRIVSGGAPVMPALLEALHVLAPQAEIVAVYGSTEAEPIAHVSYDQISAEDLRAMRAGGGLLAGHPAAAACVRVERPDASGTGEILVAGDHVVTGYLDGAGDAETKVLHEGRIWHRTGDLGRLDGAGRLWLAGRAGAALHDARGTAHPFAVECALSFEPAIARSALAGVGEKRVVAVQMRERSNADLATLRRSLQWAGIDEVRVLPRIPVDRRHNAKTDYPALRRVLGARA